MLPTTIEKQAFQFKAVCHHIGHVKIGEVASEMLDDVYAAMMKGDILSGKPSSGSYVNQMHDNLVLVFQHAVETGLLMENPRTRANPPKMDIKPKKAIRPLRIQESIDVFDPCDMRECSYLLAITMSLRRGGSAGCRGGAPTSRTTSST